MPTKRFNNLDAAKQKAIMEAAADEFARHGYEQASVNRIISAAGIGKSILYYYFENKEDLFVFTIDRYEHRFLAALDSVPRAEDPGFWERMVDYYCAFFRFLRANPLFIGLHRAIAQLSAASRANPIIERLITLERKDILNLMDQLQRLGKIRDDLPIELLREVVTVVRLTFSQYMLKDWHNWDPNNDKQNARVFVSVLRAILEQH